MLLNNVSNFYELFGNTNKTFDYNSSKNVMDRWIVSRLNQTVKQVTSDLDEYDTVTACNEIITFIDDLSTWYIRRSRDRFKSTNKEEQESAVKTLAHVLYTLSRLMAPITPFISEQIYLRLRSNTTTLKESVHLDTWPSYSDALIDQVLLEKMAVARMVVSKSLEEREKAKVPIRQAISKVTVKGADLDRDLHEIVLGEINAKQIIVENGEELSVELDTELTPELIREGILRDLVRKINNQRKEMNLTIKDRIQIAILTDDPEVKESIKQFKQELMTSIQANEIIETSNQAAQKEIEVHGSKIKVWIEVLH
jgi:isoleucyl-tRNA synthetase